MKSALCREKTKNKNILNEKHLGGNICKIYTKNLSRMLQIQWLYSDAKSGQWLFIYIHIWLKSAKLSKIYADCNKFSCYVRYSVWTEMFTTMWEASLNHVFSPLFLLLLCPTDSSARRTYSVFHSQTLTFLIHIFILNIWLLMSKIQHRQPPCIHLLQAL